MNRLGATTYWETYSPEWNDILAVGAPTPNSQTGYMSHAHPWASGAAPWLTQHVLGLKALTPGIALQRLDGSPPDRKVWGKQENCTAGGSFLVFAICIIDCTPSLSVF
jgi:hypothetical protein